MITCTGCKESKPEDDFYWKNKAKTARQEYCKACKSKYNKAWYEKNKQKHLDSVKKNKAVYVERIRELKNVSCADCYETYNYWQMEFDHLPQHVKEFDVSTASNVSLKRMLAEVDKCEVVCKNCHANRTHHRRAHRAAVRPSTERELHESVYSWPCSHPWCGV